MAELTLEISQHNSVFNQTWNVKFSLSFAELYAKTMTSATTTEALGDL